jgi:hypothetical protein
VLLVNHGSGGDSSGRGVECFLLYYSRLLVSNRAKKSRPQRQAGSGKRNSTTMIVDSGDGAGNMGPRFPYFLGNLAASPSKIPPYRNYSKLSPTYAADSGPPKELKPPYLITGGCRGSHLDLLATSICWPPRSAGHLDLLATSICWPPRSAGHQRTKQPLGRGLGADVASSH